MSIPGNVFVRQHAQRDSDKLHNHSRNWALSLAILRTKGIEKSVSEEPLQSIPLPCFSARARKKGLDDKYVLCMTNHAAGIGTCTQSGMTIPSFLSSEMHLQKFPDQTEFQSWILHFRAEVCAKAKNPALALQWIKEIEATSSLKDVINPKSITEKDFLDFEELDLMMAAELKWCYDIVYLIYEITERKTRECFQRKTLGSCSRRDTCGFPHRHAAGDARRSRLEQASSPVPKVKEQTDVKSSNCLDSPATRATFYSPVKEPETQKIVCLIWILELQCTMLSKGE